jgi:hypothetical protein
LKVPAPLLLLGGYLAARAVLGALVNPPLNGPDEAGHIEHLRTMIQTGGRHITGVESRQPATYYLLAAIPWQLTDGNGLPTQLFFVRLVSALSGLLTLGTAWAAARLLRPGQPAFAIAVAAVASLAPGYLFLVASANNDPLATGLASLAVLATLHLWRRPCAKFNVQASRFKGTRSWLVVWFVATLAAVATKLTTLPVIVALAMSLTVHWRHVVLRPKSVRALAALVGAAGLAGYAFLVSRPPTSSLAASAARFWPVALARAPLAYLNLGGLGESLRTFWYAYDYAVRWPRSLELLLGGSAVALLVLSCLGLALRRPLPWVVWAVAGAQVALVVGRYGLGDLLHIEMGGAGQAKAFFPAIVPLALLFVAGLWALARRLRLPPAGDRWLALGVFGWLVALDVVSLAVSTWQQYRWWQAGP